MPAPIHYRITPINPEAHLFEVVLTIAAPSPDGQQITLPAWIPGSYMIRDFAKNIVTIEASAENNPVRLDKLDKQSWRAAPCYGPLVITAQIYAWDLSVRGAHLDTSHAYYNATSLCLGVEGQQHKPCAVTLCPPPGKAYSNWRVATTLPRSGAEEHAFGDYQAADYDELLDHPVEMGYYTLLKFDACGVPHEVVLTGRFRVDGERLCADLKRICESQIRLFGEPAPMSRYLFQIMVTGDGYGGLEHRSSTSLICSRNNLPLPGMQEMTEEYRTLLGLCSHEYFHSWNIKRIKPALFTPYDLTREQHTPLLWFFEGVTAYYDDLMLLRSGVIDRQAYLELLGQSLTRVLRSPGRQLQSVSDSSFDAWTKFYKQDENAPNAIVSYYTKGAKVALALDLTLREASAGTHSLDDVMRALWADYQATGQGVTPEGLERRISEVVGFDLSEWFNMALRTSTEMNLEPLLTTLGLNLKLRASEGPKDMGGTPGKQNVERAALGVRSIDTPAGAQLLNVFTDSPAMRAGLSAGDLVIAIDGLRVSHTELSERVASYPIGSKIDVHAFRRDELNHHRVELSAAAVDSCYLEIDEGASEEAVARRDSWMG